MKGKKNLGTVRPQATVAMILGASAPTRVATSAQKKSPPPKPTRSIPPIPEDNFAKARDDVRRRYQTFSEFLRTMEA